MPLVCLENLHAALTVHHVDSKSSFTETSSSADPVEVRFIVWIAVFVQWKVKVDHH